MILYKNWGVNVRISKVYCVGDNFVIQKTKEKGMRKHYLKVLSAVMLSSAFISGCGVKQELYDDALNQISELNAEIESLSATNESMSNKIDELNNDITSQKDKYNDLLKEYTQYKESVEAQEETESVYVEGYGNVTPFKDPGKYCKMHDDLLTPSFGIHESLNVKFITGFNAKSSNGDLVEVYFYDAPDNDDELNRAISAYSLSIALDDIILLDMGKENEKGIINKNTNKVYGILEVKQHPNHGNVFRISLMKVNK